MPLFISSSKPGPRWAVVGVVCALMLSAHAVMVKVLPRPVYFMNTFHENMAHVQSYIYGSFKPGLVLAGSSIGARIPEDNLGEDGFNLSFHALGPSTGLEVINWSGIYPRVLIVETNEILRPVDFEMIGRLFNPLQYFLKRDLPVFREANQPGNLVFNFLKLSLGNSREHKLEQKINIEARDAEILRRMESEKLPPNRDEAAAGFKNFENLLKPLLARGVRVVLVEVPIHPLVAANPRRRWISEHFRKATRNMEWLEVGKGETFETTDGVHLTFESAIRWAKLARAEVDKKGWLK